MGTEIQDFAAELSGLKERSGLSYGALARKLHMSTSTVHRYCNGDAVPQDYAPVERFARVCRASGDELVGLHRKWILADEAKRRGARKSESAAVAVEPGDGPSGSAAPGPGPEAEPEVEPEAEPEAETEAEPLVGSDSASAAGIGAGDVTPPGEQRPAAGGSVADRPVTAPRRPSRRVRVLLAAVAVVALTVPAALVFRGLAENDGAGGGRTDVATGAAPVAPSASASSSTRSPSATPSRSASPSAGGSATATPSPPAAAPARQGGAEDDKGVPVSAVISSYNWEAPCGQHYLLDREPGTVPPPPTDPQGSRGWAKALGGVDGGDMMLELTLQGASSQAVVLKGLHVRVVSREPALAWAAYSMGEGCGSGITPQSFDIDLDDGQPHTQPVAGQDGGVVVPAKDFPYRVSSTDVEVFNLDAHVEGHDVTWYLELEWSSGDRSGTLRIDDNGKPFRTSSITGRPEYLYWVDRAEWVEAEY
ncbi:helix-turn-helix transcriptional regulator [Streptomyces clavifer]|uniref:helix-turn-helix domain-containing protein n=1 Tax=Streptomyces TaxID=1883 RepID=UPI0006F793D6|nr:MULTISPECIES: helix-turn-helix transcriptional regulator [Streptomyces]KQX90859.1 XRE family transcriptional regulator [Streptomyces sp. Root1319]KQZ12104.1 XRE family transcriptional regulator [Streptomyces sp. Root55]MDX3065322.1 helix-turn-helix transcriptional regulator [Streptomyces sp. ND04-05B]WUC28472.1 helix-turn-helix domain-containing protein [Streptomyces clavifer]